MSAAATLTPSKPSLTTNDSAVLQALFDAESSPSSAINIDSTLPPLPTHLNIPAGELSFLQSHEREIISALSSSTTPTREAIESAIKELDILITAHPTYPAAYANRAQALRMLIESPTSSENNTNTDTHLFTESNAPYVSALLSDLGTAINLSTPRSPADSVSPLQARLLADTHTHRAYLLLKVSRKLKEADNVEGVPRRLKEVGSDGLEEMASRDFFFGGRYGNKIAQQMAVQTNPYAKMCGAIVKEAIRKEAEGNQ
ncbi:protein hmgX [Aspergillus lucknowensis]|uniref:Uncharacterized protein n=1 Tax=Aspergillus lucknowensis TaxID=176173 RepID=A0ABR4M0Y3_9EURO